jgi:hypothetical protein
MNTTWKILQCNHLTVNGFIQTANWAVTVVDGDYHAYAHGICNFVIVDPVIPYSNVTEQDVLNWCWANGIDKNGLEANLAAQIEAQKNPLVINGVPWQS